MGEEAMFRNLRKILPTYSAVIRTTRSVPHMFSNICHAFVVFLL